MKIIVVIFCGLVAVNGLTIGRAPIRRRAVEAVDRLRAPRSPQVDEELDPSIEDQLAVESQQPPVRHTIQVVAIQPRYLEEQPPTLSNHIQDNEVDAETEELDQSAPSDLGVYVGGGRRSTRQAAGKYQVDDGLVDTVALSAVKIRPHGKLGALVKPRPADADHSVVGSRAVFEDAYLRRRRMSEDFIPFSEYDAQRVKTLKIEQNDFLALPVRLRALEMIDHMVRGREKRKFPEGEEEEAPAS